MTWLDYSIVGAYLVGMLVLGLMFRHQHSGKEYFLGGRTLAWPALALSVMATQLSAISFISAPAFVGLREGGGLIWLSYELALPLAVIIMLWRLLPTLHNAGVVSVYDYLEQRFSRSTRLLISAVFQISRSFATAIMIYAIALILQGTMGIDQFYAILMIGVITLIYSSMGGMKAVVYGDAIQMVLIVAGAAVCLWAGLEAAGGWQNVMAIIPAERLQAINTDTAGLDGNDFGLLPMIFGGVVLYASYYGCDQSEAQRSLSSHSITDLKKMLITVAFCRFPITALYCGTGLVIGAVVMSSPDIQAQIPADEPDWMMPVFIINYLPAGIVGILVVAILAAAMSSLSSAINSLAAVTTEDISRLTGAKLDDKRYLKRARITGITWGLITLVLSLYAGNIAPTVIEAINKIGSVFYGPVLAIFLTGIHSRRISPLAANCGLILGVSINVFLWLSDSTLFWFWWNLIGFIVTVSTSALISIKFPNDAAHKLPSVRGISYQLALILGVWSLVLIGVLMYVLPWLTTR
ncbi:sodium/solute symporter [Alteromonas sp. C1M14]|uniref:sodium:solute symporter family transporter n=1 Tax=Alteromonas sp. C1M14 TaxID=2841567 RepID=UPI001C08D9AF|nr:sodium/solute symporter [Alteromonas sp. C1M14]MBU2977612.1 sodium/solute symporter [Alteromonas sp. C1M14]